MSKPTAESHNYPRMTPKNDASGTPQSDLRDNEGKVRCTDAKGAKTTTIFGALFGAAAAAPT